MLGKWTTTIIAALLISSPSLLVAQNVRFPSTVPLTDATGGTSPILPGTGIRPVAPTPGGFGTVPTIDPYTSAPLTNPAFAPNLYGAPIQPPVNSPWPSNLPPTGFSGTSPGLVPNPAGPSSYAPSIYPNNSPQALFPNGINNPYGNWQAPNFDPTTWFNGANPNGSLVNNSIYPNIQKFFLGPRIRHAWVAGSNSDNGLQIHDTDVSVAFQIPQFFGSTQPLYVIPSFSLHLWDGPVASTGADLPSSAYSAFVDFGWETDPNKILGVDLGARIGMFTDFDTATTDSVRYMGKLLGKVRLTPTALLRAGVMYVDRNDIKIIPAGGLLWQPNQNSRLDLFFPEPKLSNFLTTVGATDLWWYIGGYYGGGSWTIKRDAGNTDAIDINDLRVMVGLEWGQSDQLRTGRRFGFAELGYVFDREIIYVKDPSDTIDIANSVVLRAGIAY